MITNAIRPMMLMIMLIVVPITISVIAIAHRERQDAGAREVDLLAGRRRRNRMLAVAHGWT